jgi:hypothetical protein
LLKLIGSALFCRRRFAQPGNEPVCGERGNKNADQDHQRAGNRVGEVAAFGQDAAAASSLSAALCEIERRVTLWSGGHYGQDMQVAEAALTVLES